MVERLIVNEAVLAFLQTAIYNSFLTSGRSSVVERLVANEKVVGSSPIARSKEYMEDLSKKKCVPCEGGIPSFNLSEIHKYLKKVDGWDVKKMTMKIFIY